MSSLLAQASSFSRGDALAHSQNNRAPFQLDAALQSFSHEATRVGNVAAMLGASFAFQATRLAALSIASPYLAAGPLLPWFCQSASYAAALGTEAFAFTRLQRSFQESSQSFSQDYIHSLLSLASLKIFSLAAGQSIFLQHLCGDLGMVASHRMAILANLQASTSQSFFEELFSAEALTWQMNAGIALARGLLPQTQRIENALQGRSQRHLISNTQAASEMGLATHSAQSGKHSGHYTHVDRRHRSVRAYFTGGVIGAVTRMEAIANDAEISRPALREKWLSRLPAALREKIHQYGKDYAVVFLPGMYNPLPDPAWMNLISSAFGKGGLVISTAPGRHKVRDQGLYSMLGDNVRVLQHFELEVAHVFQRLAIALRDPSLLRGVDRLVLMGHSKGGILSHALKTLQKAYAENGGRLPAFFYDLYPGLDRIPEADIELTMQVLKHSFFEAIDWPVEGIPDLLSVRVVDYFMLEGVAQGFEEKRMRDYFLVTGLSPADMDLAIETRMPNLRECLLNDHHPGSTLEALVYRATGMFFYGISHVMAAQNGDGLLRANRKHPGKVLRGRYNHLDAIVSLKAGEEILELTFEEFERRASIANP